MHNQPLRLGMIGGGPGAFIGAVHRLAARMDGHYQLVAGCFSSSPDKNQQMQAQPGLEQCRLYDSFEQLIAAEAQLQANERIQVLSIVTPNHLHFAPAKLAMEAGMDVVIDKPIALNLQEALTLKTIAEQQGRRICLTHTYSAYPMVRQARHLATSGKLGTIRKIYVEYPQGWLSQPLEQTEQKQAAWRTDPGKSGKAGALGDIGTHAFNMAEFVSGLQAVEVLAMLNTVVAGRQLDDDGCVLMKMNNGATCVLMTTQVATGEENNIKIRVYGTEAGLEWQQLHNNSLVVNHPDRPAEIYRTGNAYNGADAQALHRVPPGHPEGYLEAFANIYTQFALHLKGLDHAGYPTVDDGIRGMQFIDAAVQSQRQGNSWTKL